MGASPSGGGAFGGSPLLILGAVRAPFPTLPHKGTVYGAQTSRLAGARGGPRPHQRLRLGPPLVLLPLALLPCAAVLPGHPVLLVRRLLPRRIRELLGRPRGDGRRPGPGPARPAGD